MILIDRVRTIAPLLRPVSSNRLWNNRLIRGTRTPGGSVPFTEKTTYCFRFPYPEHVGRCLSDNSRRCVPEKLWPGARSHEPKTARGQTDIRALSSCSHTNCFTVSGWTLVWYVCVWRGCNRMNRLMVISRYWAEGWWLSLKPYSPDSRYWNTLLFWWPSEHSESMRWILLCTHWNIPVIVWTRNVFDQEGKAFI